MKSFKCRFVVASTSLNSYILENKHRIVAGVLETIYGMCGDHVWRPCVEAMYGGHMWRPCVEAMLGACVGQVHTKKHISSRTSRYSEACASECHEVPEEMCPTIRRLVFSHASNVCVF